MLYDIVVNLVSGFASTVLAIVASATVYAWYEKRRWGGWRIRIVRGDTLLEEQVVGIAKAKSIFADASELNIYCKSNASPYGMLRFNPISTKAKEVGLMKIDDTTRSIIIDFDKNPEPPPAPVPQQQQQSAQQQQQQKKKGKKRR